MYSIGHNNHYRRKTAGPEVAAGGCRPGLQGRARASRGALVLQCDARDAPVVRLDSPISMRYRPPQGVPAACSFASAVCVSCRDSRLACDSRAVRVRNSSAPAVAGGVFRRKHAVCSQSRRQARSASVSGLYYSLWSPGVLPGRPVRRAIGQCFSMCRSPRRPTSPTGRRRRLVRGGLFSARASPPVIQSRPMHANAISCSTRSPTLWPMAAAAMLCDFSSQ